MELWRSLGHLLGWDRNCPNDNNNNNKAKNTNEKIPTVQSIIPMIKYIYIYMNYLISVIGPKFRIRPSKLHISKRNSIHQQ